MSTITKANILEAKRRLQSTRSLAKGDHGRVTLDGKEVAAVSCNPEYGWAICLIHKDGTLVKIGESPEFDEDGEVRTAEFHGVVTFEPTEVGNGKPKKGIALEPERTHIVEDWIRPS